MVIVRDSWSRSIYKTAAGSNKAASATEDAAGCKNICGSGDVHLNQSKIFHGKESALSIGRNAVAA
jgi:hypothetical protein